MRIIAGNPSGAVTVLDLAQLGACRLMLSGQEEYLGVGVRYLGGANASGPVFGLLMLAAITIPGLPPNSFDQIVKHGLTGVSEAKDKERLKEAMKILFNSPVKPAVIDEAITKADGVIEFYWWLRPFFLGTQRPIADAAADERVLGHWNVRVVS